MHTTELSTKGGRRTYLTAGATGEINNNPRYYQRIMAKRKYSAMKRNSKIEPAVMTIRFAGISVSGGGGVIKHIDLSQCASIVNRRFYRQGINWAVAGIKVLTLSSTGSPKGIVSVQKLPNTWVMAQAWKKAFATWQKMNRESTSESPSIRPKFLDFKIYADANHHGAGPNANLIPGGYTKGEWVYSKIYVPNTTTSTPANLAYEMIATGPNFSGAGPAGLNAVSLIEGYAASRALPYEADPNMPTDADDTDGVTPQNWMQALFNDGTEQDSAVVGDMITDNEIAPYPFENDGTAVDTMYPNGANQAPGLQLHDEEFITGTTIGGTTRLKGGNFPAGLIQMSFTNQNTPADQTDYFVYIDLVPGNHRGYLCEPMTEM